MAGKAKESPSVESSVEAAWNESESDAADAAGEAEVEDIETGGEAREGAGEAEGGQPRDASGRFASAGEGGDDAEQEAEEDAGGAGGEQGGEEGGEADRAAGGEGDGEAAAEGEGEQPGVGAAGGAEAEAAAAAAAAGAAAAGRFQSWRPAERETLLKLKGPEGDAVRAAVHRREAQFESYRRETEDIRGFANDFVRRAEPYRPLYAMLKTTPMQAFDILMQTAAVLYQGDDRMKAQKIAETIMERGVNVEMVADFLDGKTSDGRQVQPPDPHVAQLTGEVQRLNQRIEQQQQAEERRAQALADAHVASWAKGKPWYADVKKRMALLMKAADESGDELTLDQAYATAVSLDPEVSKLEAQRRKAEQVKKQKLDMLKARRAASSPRGSPVVRAKGTPRGSVEDDVSAAWDEAEGRIAS